MTTDPILRWNAVLLDVIRRGGGPAGPLARGAAMMHAAVHDAVNAIVPAHVPYLVAIPASPDASIDAAIAQAAHDALLAVFPSTPVDVGGALRDVLATLPASPAVAAGRAIGTACAYLMIAAREHDGAAAGASHADGAKPGEWRSTDGAHAASPQWRAVTPFTMSAPSQFRPPAPGGGRSPAELLRGREYARQLAEVKALGEATSARRTAEQTEIAFFWSNDADGTCKPVGQLLQITRAVSEQRGLGVVDNARLFALVSLALADAAICAWDAKYTSCLWRPETAVHEAGDDANPRTEADAAWEPLSHEGAVHRTPPSPSYVSAHATLAAAHATVMRLFFGSDDIAFTVTSEDPNLPAGAKRSFDSFSEAAAEHARSRVLLGVSFGWDTKEGARAGAALAEALFRAHLCVSQDTPRFEKRPAKVSTAV